MSLLLCRQEPVKNPFYIEVLDIHIFSSQELCYVIFNHPLLVMDEFVDSALFDFIRQDLGLGTLADRMEKLMETGSRPEEILSLFLMECDYYTEKEIQQFKAVTASYRKMPAGEYEKARADYMFGKRQYGRAAVRYEEVLEGLEDAGEAGRDSREKEAFRAKLYNNLGAAYAQMFQFHKALAAYEKAYELGESRDVLKRMYFLDRFAPELEIKRVFTSQMKEEEKKQWDQETAQAALDGEQAEEVRALRNLFKKDPVKRMNGAVGLVGRWKQEYRKMV